MTDPLLSLFQARGYPEIAHAVAERRAAILCRWEAAVQELLPHADRLTFTDLRNSLPETLDNLVLALTSTSAATTRRLLLDGSEHGITRYHQHFNLAELLLEYDLLRPILVEETASDLAREITLGEVIALNTGLDLAARRSVISYVAFQRKQLETETASGQRLSTFLSGQLHQVVESVHQTLGSLKAQLAATEHGQQYVSLLEGAIGEIGNLVAATEHILAAPRDGPHAAPPA